MLYFEHLGYLKIFRSKKSERAILQHKGEQEKCRALMAGSLEEKSIPLSWKAQHLNTGEERVKCSSPRQCLPGKIPSWPKVW